MAARAATGIMASACGSSKSGTGPALRSERFFDDLYAYKFDGIDAPHLVKWLKAAYEVGHAHALSRLEDDGK